MSLNNISGGSNFSLGKFRQNLGSATKFGALKNLRTPISKIIETSSAAIKGGRFKAADAMRRLQSESGQSSVKLNYEAKRDVRRIFDRLEATPAQNEKAEPEKISRREMLDRALKKKTQVGKPTMPGKPTMGAKPEMGAKPHINRGDSDFNQNQVKDNRASAIEERLTTGTGVSGPSGPSNQPVPNQSAPVPPVTSAIHHETINLN
ncbi:MAG: hypothetical protein WC467_02575 [Patescibacteria group bacterium]